MKFNFFRNYFSNKKTNKILLLLLIVDILFIISHVVFIYLIFIRVQFDWSISNYFMVDNDDSIPEFFQYLKYLIVIITLIYFLFKRKGIGYAAWLLLFILLLLDDSLQFHERFGTWVAEKFNYAPMFGLRAQDLGELTYVGEFGFLFLLFFTLGYYFGNETYRKVNIDLILLFGLFLFFGVGVDMLDEILATNRYSLLFFVLLEDGGEMIALSLIVWYFFFLIVKPNDHNKYLFQYFWKRKKSIN